MTFSEKLKALRKEQKITQEQLAKILGVERSSVGKYETGTLPSMEILTRIATYFDVSTDYLLGRDEIKKEPDGYEKDYNPKLNDKDERDISRRLDEMLSDLDRQGSALMFDGEPLDEESRELLIDSLKNSIRMAKLINKRKYTPKKYRKGSWDESESDMSEG